MSGRTTKVWRWLISAGALGVIAALAFLARQGAAEPASQAAGLEQAAPPRTHPPLAITHVHVVPMDRDTILPDHTVLVRDGRIVEIGPSHAVVVPADALVVEGRGKYLLPGLADMHVHVWGDRALRWLVANGVTSVRNMWGAPMHLRPRDPAFAPYFFGPTIYTSGPIIDGDPPWWEGSTVLSDPAGAAALVQEQKSAGYDFLKIYVRLEEEVFFALADAAAEAGMPVAGHVPNAVGLEKALEYRPASIEHLNGWGYAIRRRDAPPLPVTPAAGNLHAWADVDEDRLAMLVRATVEAGTWNCPTLVVRERLQITRERADSLLALEEMQRLDPETREQWGNQATRAPELAAVAEATRPARLGAVKALHDAGAGLLLGTDAGNPFIVHGFAVHDELDLFVMAGLTPYEAIRTGTSAAARFLGASDDFGTVAPGLRADLVLVDGNPLEDVRHLRTPLGVVLRGEWFPADALHEMLEWVPPPPAAGPAALRTMSFNVRYGTTRDGDDAWEHRRDHLIEVIEAYDPHVLGLQEALRFQIDEILEALPHLGEIGVGRDDGVNAGEYSSILYDRRRLELLDGGTFWLSDTPEVPGSTSWGNRITRIATWAGLRDRTLERDFHVFNTHWDHESQPSRERSAELVLLRIAKIGGPDAPAILMGDFNAGEDNPAYRALLAGAGEAAPGAPGSQTPAFVDTYRTLHPDDGHDVGTFHAFGGDPSGDKIDGILVTSRWRTLEAAIVRTHRNGRYPSDHFPVTATLELARD